MLPRPRSSITLSHLTARHHRFLTLSARPTTSSPSGPASHDSLLAPHSPASPRLPSSRLADKHPTTVPPRASQSGFTTTSLLAPHYPTSPRLPSWRLTIRLHLDFPPLVSLYGIPRVPRASQPGTLEFPSSRLADRHLMTYLLSPQWPAFPATSLLQSQSGGPIFLLSPDNPASPRFPSSRLTDKHPTTLPPRTSQSDIPRVPPSRLTIRLHHDFPPCASLSGFTTTSPPPHPFNSRVLTLFSTIFSPSPTPPHCSSTSLHHSHRTHSVVLNPIHIAAPRPLGLSSSPTYSTRPHHRRQAQKRTPRCHQRRALA
ncbi:hypothetical protein KNP414_05642 [Paenibacillus mucilaginosus KNP414]|uniref:Uncharacterized protein n=1 Tax=Paenibacillus mucilaginosus (strain KNP414) TaxID=1036673 RepID=F8FLN9_PAEMK|nr:hypothetical protein KNP414_05642 [Paenibacillus mucilaginosus KNP414]